MRRSCRLVAGAVFDITEVIKLNFMLQSTETLWEMMQGSKLRRGLDKTENSVGVEILKSL